MTEGYQSYKKEPEHNNVPGFLSPVGFHNKCGSHSGSTPGEQREQIISRLSTQDIFLSHVCRFLGIKKNVLLTGDSPGMVFGIGFTVTTN